MSIVKQALELIELCLTATKFQVFDFRMSIIRIQARCIGKYYHFKKTPSD